jgi:hypothetical protein
LANLFTVIIRDNAVCVFKSFWKLTFRHFN